MLSLINSGFRILVAVALFWIGLPYAVLWGVTAASLWPVRTIVSFSKNLAKTERVHKVFPL